MSKEEFVFNFDGVCEARAPGHFHTSLVNIWGFLEGLCWFGVLKEGSAGNCFALINAQTRDGGYA